MARVQEMPLVPMSFPKVVQLIFPALMKPAFPNLAKIAYNVLNCLFLHHVFSSGAWGYLEGRSKATG